MSDLGMLQQRGEWVVTKVLIDISKCVVVTESHGGYTGGKCIGCDEHGYLCEHRLGLPHGQKMRPNNYLIHKEGCPVGENLKEDGTVKD